MLRQAVQLVGIRWRGLEIKLFTLMAVKSLLFPVQVGLVLYRTHLLHWLEVCLAMATK